jgi:hypothetical protein
MERYVALVVNVPAVPASHCAFVVGVKTYVAVLVNVPGVVAASHSAFVVVPQTAGFAPAQVPALSKHSVWVPGHAAVSHVPSGMSGTAPAQVPALSLHSTSVPVHADPSHVPITYTALLVNVPGVVAAASHSAFVVVPGTSGFAPAQVPLPRLAVETLPPAYVAVLVNVPAVVAAASHSAFVVVPGTSGVAPAQVPALSSHAA